MPREPEEAAAGEQPASQQQGEQQQQREGIDYAAFYRRSCERRQCRVNSAVAARLEAASFRPLTLLDLAANYVGPKGVLPVIDLLERNPTVEALDLSRNGLDNSSVTALTQVLRSHLGLTELNLSHNAITQTAGKELFALVEANERICLLDLSGTEVYDSLVRRIQVGVNRNRELRRLQPLMQSSVSRPQQSHGGPALRRLPRATEEASPQRSRAASEVADEEPGEGVPAPKGDAGLAPRVPPPRNQRKPRPTPPMMASSGYRRMTQAEREQARADYQRRLAGRSKELDEHLRPAVQRAELTGAASAEARRKIELLEREQRSVVRAAAPGTELNQEAVLAQRKAEEAAAVKARLQATQAGYDDEAGGVGAAEGDTDELAFLSDEAKALIAAQDAKIVHAESEAEKARVRREQIEREQRLRDELADQAAASSRPQSAAVGEAEEKAAEPDASGAAASAACGAAAVVAMFSAPIRDPISVIAAADRLAEILSADELADRMRAVPPKEEPKAARLQMPEGAKPSDPHEAKFFELFNAGSAAYDAGDMQLAYEKWTEAHEMAAKGKNSEWRAVISGNLQALSYQLLTLQGDELLQQGELDEALHCLRLARDVATEARNCQWERATDATMNSVRRAQFKDKYSAGAASFEPLVAELEQRWQDCPDGARAPEPIEEGGTVAFARELPRVLRLREALKCWAEAAAIATSVTGRGASELVEMVRFAVDSAFKYEQAILLAPQGDIRPTHSVQGTARFASKERTRLLELWTELMEAVSALDSPLWQALTASRVGNLQHSLFQNTSAVESLRRSMQLAQSSGHRALEGAARTHLGRVFAGLARFSQAEKELWAGEAVWAELLAQPESGSTAQCPRAYLVEQQVSCYDTLQQVMIGQHRYQEGLEIAERMRAHLHDDKMHDKMKANFDTRATVDHMYSIARGCQTVLVMYSVVHRFDWNVDAGRAESEEQLYMWAVPPEGELKFVQVAVTRDHSTESLEPLIDSARAALGVLSDGERRLSGRPLTSGVITDAPSYAWRGPLQQLYDFLIYPIADFLAVTAGVEYVPHRKVTFVPHTFLHLVPWAALLDGQGKFLVEDFNIQVAPTVQCLALARLNAVKLRGQGLSHQQLAVVGMPAEHPAPQLRPFDDVLTDDSQAIAAALGDLQPLRDEAATRASLLSLLPSCRLLHVCSEVLAEARVGPVWGALAATDGLVTSADIESLELHCELVVLQCSNHSKQAIRQGGDGAVGLQRALLCAGVPTVICGMWATPNQSAAGLMADFYQLLRDADRADKAVALSVAQRRFIQHSPYSPAEWGGFYTTGVATL
eukprot:TRINITY_DN42870_c0_g1_i1.p1 TRINITY_DN42870_c0_g1~~TRINITY_DN42870_c0_g1_i1.p1  ORF type:complete len:1333 (+),score=509.17 TRINITY_DN42870_c0_g1_i1:56-4000(+)